MRRRAFLLGLAALAATSRARGRGDDSALEAAVDRIAADALERRPVPGLSVAVARSGRIVLAKPIDDLAAQPYRALHEALGRKLPTDRVDLLARPHPGGQGKLVVVEPVRAAPQRSQDAGAVGQPWHKGLRLWRIRAQGT